MSCHYRLEICIDRRCRDIRQYLCIWTQIICVGAIVDGLRRTGFVGGSGVGHTVHREGLPPTDADPGPEGCGSGLLRSLVEEWRGVFRGEGGEELIRGDAVEFGEVTARPPLRPPGQGSAREPHLLGDLLP